VTTTTHHDIHHEHGPRNFGLYFTPVWRLTCGSVHETTALPASEMPATKYPAEAVTLGAHESPPPTAEPRWPIREGNELVDADPCTVCICEPINNPHSIHLSNNADRADGLASPRPRYRIATGLEHASPAKPGEVDAVRAFTGRRGRVTSTAVPPNADFQIPRNLMA
jgi:hypothetical protein